MVSEYLGIEIPLVVDSSEVYAEFNALQAKLDDFARKEVAMVKKFDRAVLGMMVTIRSLASVFRSVISYFGFILDPIQEAILMAIQTSMTAALAIHRTLEAATLTLSGVVTIGLSVLAITMSIAAIGQATAGMADARAQTDKAALLMTQIESIIATSQIWM